MYARFLFWIDEMGAGMYLGESGPEGLTAARQPTRAGGAVQIRP